MAVSVLAGGGESTVPRLGRYRTGKLDADIAVGEEGQGVALEIQHRHGLVGVGNLQDKPVASVGDHTEVLITPAGK